MFATTRPIIERARAERRSGNLPEVLLWRALRTKPGGFKFRRQHPIDAYILDFSCLSARLAIEVDGEIHARGERPRFDVDRDAALMALGFRVLRVPAAEVLRDIDPVVRAITAACASPLHHPAVPDGPPPRSREVWICP